MNIVLQVSFPDWLSSVQMSPHISAGSSKLSLGDFLGKGTWNFPIGLPWTLPMPFPIADCNLCPFSNNLWLWCPCFDDLSDFWQIVEQGDLGDPQVQ